MVTTAGNSMGGGAGDLAAGESLPLNMRLAAASRATPVREGLPGGNSFGETAAISSSVTSYPPLRYCGSGVVDARKYREELLMITRNHEDMGKRMYTHPYYKWFLMGIVVGYSCFLGFCTLLDWHDFSTPWVTTIFVFRFLFFVVFTFDLIMQSTQDMNIKIYRNPEFLVDLALLICEAASTIYVAHAVLNHCSSLPVVVDKCQQDLNNLRIWSCIPLLRLYKLCMHCGPLRTLTKGILLSIQSLAWTAVFVVMVIYACAIYTTWVFTEVKDDEMDDYWGTLLRSMYTLFTIMTLEGWNQVSNDTAKFYPNSKLFFVIFVCFATLTVMNVVTGIILNTFLTVNEKFSEEKCSKGRCDRYAEVTSILGEAIKGAPSGEQACMSREATSQFVSARTCSKDTMEEHTAASDISNAGNQRMKGEGDKLASKMMKVGQSIGLKMRNTMWRIMPALARSREEITGEIIFGDIERGDADDHNNAPAGGTQSLNLPEPLTPTNARGGATVLQDGTSPSTSRKPTASEILNDLMDAVETSPSGELSTLTAHLPVRSPGAPAPQPAANNSIQGACKVNMSGDMRSNDCVVYGYRNEGEVGSTEMLRFVAAQTGDHAVIDMTFRDPYATLTDPSIKQALRHAGVPMFQAYEVLNMYYANGLYQVTVSEFAAACERLPGNTSGKDLLSFELAFARRLSVLEARIAQVGSKLDLLLEYFANSAVAPGNKH
ncbi:VOLTAGE-GATED CATION CHANNEL (CALCIUM AND SODIUM), putative [Babesia bigemina]|uniref:VOLTAGE-GATED CATION CHANNEL (CALCIUM AND SODIUM), putative n=1 Tax=Babesia bigemina TaxID=5866 RepID=A0A061DCY1_BABBI|nr:VOLTAGE-GATED CATION CHANNEL (CALCIUM AND SODIUM), putative [Babesia bigemina]CDR96969.1 VOLTAGE-GATED CATION CHANNEL (CALCIUM AND SODIUM), putative [Babesia bigemina]|eukprot:XP_012769155.1 VOLTAGE-GATED CATION CHANNEL (CALCIUM AND SODIUM), putative [Babesia bigemina]